MGILKTRETNYYKLDWDCPDTPISKVYLAIKGKIEKGTVFPLMLDGVGYDWEENENSKIIPISKQEFLSKANATNIVNFNDTELDRLLNYPKGLQKVIDNQMLNAGTRPPKILSIKQELQLLQARKRNRKILHSFESCYKNEKER